MSKVIDVERKGNVVRFCLGADDCNDYWGDDWDDRPYEHNAGSVYDEFVVGHYDVPFKYDCCVVEPCSGECNSLYSKDDMKNGKVPCIVVVPLKENEYNWMYDGYTYAVGNKDAVKIYFNDSLADLIEKVKDLVIE